MKKRSHSLLRHGRGGDSSAWLFCIKAFRQSHFQPLSLPHLPQTQHLHSGNPAILQLSDKLLSFVCPEWWCITLPHTLWLLEFCWYLSSAVASSPLIVFVDLLLCYSFPIILLFFPEGADIHVSAPSTYFPEDSPLFLSCFVPAVGGCCYNPHFRLPSCRMPAGMLVLAGRRGRLRAWALG